MFVARQNRPKLIFSEEGHVSFTNFGRRPLDNGTTVRSR